MNGALRLDTRQWLRRLRPDPILGLGCLILGALALWLWLRGAGFYGLPLAERVEHADFSRLSPGRPVGRGYGLTGLSLLCFNLGYLLRRRVPHWPVGPMQLWLNLHVLSGLAAALFALYHSAFQARSATALVIASGLGVTLLTGLVGRFFHALGRARSPQLQERLAALDALAPGAAAPLRDALARALAELTQAEHGLLRATVRGRRRLAETRAGVARTLPAEVYLSALTRDVERVCLSELHAALGGELLRVWRPWHRACALAVVAGVVLHVAVAFFYGYS